MHLAQDGLCAICKKPEVEGKSLAVDHDHKTQTVRFLLCKNCNQGLGFFLDSPVLLARAAQYLLSHDQSRKSLASLHLWASDLATSSKLPD